MIKDIIEINFVELKNDLRKQTKSYCYNPVKSVK